MLDPDLDTLPIVLGQFTTLGSCGDLAATAGSLLLASALRAALEQSRTLSVFSHLPLEDEQIARRLWWTVPGLACVGLWFMGLA